MIFCKLYNQSLILVFQAGTYSNTTHCIDCYEGHYCPSAPSKPIPCPPGTYANAEGFASCLACPAGFECLNATVNPTSCLAGTYSIQGQVSCLVSLIFNSLVI